MSPVLPVLALAAVLGLAPSAGAAQAGRVLRHDGLLRTFVVRVPPAVEASPGKVPLVLVLHGGGGNAAFAERMTGFTRKAMREGFIVAYPEGTGQVRGRLLTWNAGHCCGFAMRSGVDDVGFIRALVDRLEKELPVDPARVYVTGMSNGAMMAHRLGIALADRLAAIAPVVGAVFGDEPAPARPVSVLAINGELDRSVPLLGGPPGGRFPNAWDGTPTRPASGQGAFWATADGCEAIPDARDEPAVATTRYRCPRGLAVRTVVVKGMGHAWPGGERGSRRGDDPGEAMDATDEIWTFFRAHPRAGAAP